MGSGTFVLFPLEVTHINGPESGNIYVFLAVQLSWVESEIDENNIADSEKIVKYVGLEIPRELLKTKDDLKRAIRHLTEGIQDIPDIDIFPK